MYQNKVNLIGFLGGDAEVRNVNNRSFTTLSLATKSSYKDKKRGEYVAHKALRAESRKEALGDHCLRSHWSDRNRAPWPRVHPLDGVRKDRLSFLGLAKGISRLRILQGGRRRDDERDESFNDHVSDQRCDECQAVQPSLIYIMPGLIMLCFVAGFVLLKIPTMTASLFSGHVGGQASGLSGLVTAVVARAL